MTKDSASSSAGSVSDTDSTRRGEGVADHESRSDGDRVEEFEVAGDDLLKRVRELIHEGNIRRIIIATEDGKTLIEVPVTIGVVGALLLPVWAAVGAVAAVVTNCTIRVELRDDVDD